jgi:hypothetical protein
VSMPKNSDFAPFGPPAGRPGGRPRPSKSKPKQDERPGFPASRFFR